MKNNKGITLIALVITIIVMLILVTVTIQVATNGNLFSHAGNAVKETKKAAIAENALADGNIGDKSIDEIVAEATGESGETATYKTYNVGDEISIAGELFYVIEDSDEHTSSVKLLAALNVEIDDAFKQYNKQYADASKVAFDSSTPYTSDYYDQDAPTIKNFVDTYAASLGVTIEEARLMTLAELINLGAENGSDGGRTGDCPSFINSGLHYWLLTPGNISESVRIVYGDMSEWGEREVSRTGDLGLRPVIVILKNNIPRQLTH